MRKLLAAAVILLSSALMTGCFDIEQTLTLERNLSGKAGFTMKIDMEPMITFMAMMGRSMEGKSGPPTKDELDKIKKEMLTSKTEKPDDFEQDKKELIKTLPKGVTLQDASFVDQGLKMTANFVFGFDNVAKLAQIKFPKKKEDPQGGAPGPDMSNPVDDPFKGLKVVDDGKTVLVTAAMNNPVADDQKQLAPKPGEPQTKEDKEMAKMMEDMFAGLRVAYKITSPMEVVEHNATRKEGNTLIWEYTIKNFEKLTPEQLAQGVRVRYKK